MHYLSDDTKRLQAINRTFWILLTIFTILGMTFTYFIIYIREVKYLFPTSTSEYSAVRDMVEEITETKLPENSDILLAYDRLCFINRNHDEISIVIRLPTSTASKYEYLVSAGRVSPKAVWSMGNVSVIKLSYTSGSRDRLTEYICQNGKERIDIVTPVYIPICVLILLFYYILYMRIKKRIHSANDGGKARGTNAASFRG